MLYPIITQRLILRSFSESDRMQMIRILRNDEISKTFMLPEFPDDAAAGRLFDRILNHSLQDEHFERAVCLGETVIGFVNDVEIQDGTIELGYVIHPDYQGRGYATEALSASIWALFHLGYSTVQAGFFEDNPASSRVMEKCGMHRISKVENIPYRGVVHRCLYHEMENPLRPLGDFIRYIPVADQPLSAEVYFIRGKQGIYLYDVGNNRESLACIRSLPHPPVAILSHHHTDHTGNLSELKFAQIYVGAYTQERLNLGTVVTEALNLEEGLTVIPCPSVHTPGSLILDVYGQYCLIGDLFFHRGAVAMETAQQMLETLARVDTQYFVISHGAADSVYSKEVFLWELQKEFEKEDTP